MLEELKSLNESCTVNMELPLVFPTHGHWNYDRTVGPGLSAAASSSSI